MSKYLGGVLHLGDILIKQVEGEETVVLTEEQKSILIELAKKAQLHKDIKQVLANIDDTVNEYKYYNKNVDIHIEDNNALYIKIPLINKYELFDGDTKLNIIKEIIHIDITSTLEITTNLQFIDGVIDISLS